MPATPNSQTDATARVIPPAEHTHHAGAPEHEVLPGPLSGAAGHERRANGAEAARLAGMTQASVEAQARAGGHDGRTSPSGTAYRESFANRLVQPTRFLVAIPCAGLLIAAVSLIVSTFLSALRTTMDALEGALSMQDMLVSYIESADFFLLSIVLYIMAVGLYSLFIDDTVKTPGWLQIRTLDDLKEKLVGVIVVVMGVYFLGQLIHGTNTTDLLFMGLGIGAVALSLTYFVRHVISAHTE